MNAIPFIRDFNFEYACVEKLSPLVQRITAENPGAFTYTGTGVFLIGTTQIAIIDPGPDLPAHRKAIEDALVGKKLTHILITHHHLDHSPLALPLARQYGCKVYGYGRQVSLPVGEGDARLEAGDDVRFKPDIEIESGHKFYGDGWTIEAIHTPGHTSNHMCYALPEENTLFSGDHIMGWSTSVVSPPDGHMGDYLRALTEVKRRNFDIIRPTHGPSITEVDTFVSAYIEHRLEREKQIYMAIQNGLKTIPRIVNTLYADIDKRLHPAAAHSVLAHLIYLGEQGRITCNKEIPTMRAHFMLPT